MGSICRKQTPLQIQIRAAGFRVYSLAWRVLRLQLEPRDAVVAALLRAVGQFGASAVGREGGVREGMEGMSDRIFGLSGSCHSFSSASGNFPESRMHGMLGAPEPVFRCLCLGRLPRKSDS